MKTYVGKDLMTGEYIVHEQLPSGHTAVVKYKTQKEADDAVIADHYRDGGIEEFSHDSLGGE